MKKKLVQALLACTFVGICIISCKKEQATSTTTTTTTATKFTVVEIQTTSGNMLMWLYDKTPLHKNNFLKLIRQKFYDNLLFHRVVKDFVIQGGDPSGDGTGGVKNAIPAEIFPDLKHVYGAVGAARLDVSVNPDKKSNGSQFYIVVNKDGTSNLDGGYTVFGIIFSGMDAAMAISNVAVSNQRPLQDVHMTKVDTMAFTAEELLSKYKFTVPK